MNITILVIVAIGVAILLDIAFVWFRRNRRLSHTRTNQSWDLQSRLQKIFKHLNSFAQEATKERVWFLLGGIFARGNFKALARFLAIILCVGLFVLGQYMMARSKPIGALSAISRQINSFFRVDVHNLDNVIISIILLGCSAIFLYRIMRNIDIENRAGSIGLPEFKKTTVGFSKISKWALFALFGCLTLMLLLWRLSKSSAETLDTVLWGISFGLFLFAVLGWDRSHATSLKIHLSNLEIIQVLFLLVLGLLIGAYQLQEIPNALMGDEGFFFETASAIANGSYNPSPFDFGVFTFPVLSSFWQAAILKIFGNGLWGWRFSAVLPSVLSIIPLYLLARDLFGKLVGFVASLVFITLPYSLAFARLGYNNSQSILTTTLCIWLLYLGLKKGSAFYLFLAGVASGLGFLTYTAGRIGIVIIFLFWMGLLLSRSISKNQKSTLLFASIPIVIGWVLVASPHLIFGYQKEVSTFRNKMLESVIFQVDYAESIFSENPNLSDQQIVSIDHHQLFYEPLLYFRLIGRGLIRTGLAFYHEGLITEHFITGSLLVPVAALFFSFGIIYSLRRLRDPGYLLILIWFICALLCLSVFNTFPPRQQHLVPLIPVMALFIGLGIVVFTELMISWIRSNSRWRKLLRLGLIGIATVVICLAGIQDYFVKMPRTYRPNLENFVNWYGLQHASDTHFVYLYDDPKLANWQPYLFRQIIQDVEYNSADVNEVLRSRFISIRPNELLSGRSAISLQKNLVVFFDNSNAELIIQNLLPVLPKAKLVTIVGLDKAASGYIILQGDLGLPMPAFLLAGLKEEFSTPVMWLVIPLLILMVYFLSKEIRFWHRKHYFQKSNS